MSDGQLGGSTRYPPVVGAYVAADAGTLGATDTGSSFILDGVGARYLLPTQLHDGLVTPTTRLLSVSLATPGRSAVVVSGSPASDFKAIVFASEADWARVSWSSDLRARSSRRASPMSASSWARRAPSRSCTAAGAARSRRGRTSTLGPRPSSRGRGRCSDGASK